MVHAAWGKKRVCPGCSVRYYDLGRTTPTCPKCGTPIDVHTIERSKRRSLGGISSTDIEAIDGLDFELPEDEETNLNEEVLDEDSYGDNLPGMQEKNLRDDL